ncbi:hypothetical protein DFP90_112127 [Aestuariispira insulae]|uniref:HEPN domain-containing protein n=1 Tax=Aestuariispira insulae TaxID=1461337 RepID=A0A3D9H6J4_9PROT|nr:hypothetical protein DFP90_112127 [Aestuariispira insulae]
MDFFRAGVSRSNYQFRDDDLLKLQQNLFSKINLSNYALIRGLYCLVKASMLVNSRSLAEEAAYNLFIALDVAFHLILRKLADAGVQNPSTRDAQFHLEEVFGQEHTNLKFFDEFYDDRIKSFHPISRLGRRLYGPETYSELYQLKNHLKETYKCVILGLDPLEAQNP